MLVKLGLVYLSVQTLLVPGLFTMGPTRSGDSARRKPRGKLHPGMANGKGGPSLSIKDSNLSFDANNSIFMQNSLSKSDFSLFDSTKILEDVQNYKMSLNVILL